MGSKQDEDERLGWQWTDEGTEAKRAKEILDQRLAEKKISAKQGESMVVNVIVFVLIVVALAIAVFALGFVFGK